jgi:hypothetical protein
VFDDWGVRASVNLLEWPAWILPIEEEVRQGSICAGKMTLAVKSAFQGLHYVTCPGVHEATIKRSLCAFMFACTDNVCASAPQR